MSKSEPLLTEGLAALRMLPAAAGLVCSMPTAGRVGLVGRAGRVAAWTVDRGGWLELRELVVMPATPEEP